MADPRFFTNHGPFTLAEIAGWTGAALQQKNAEKVSIRDVAPLDKAGEEEISFLDNIKYIASFESSRARACFIRSKFVEKAPPGMALLVCDDPYYSYALTAQHFYPARRAVPGISAQAHIDATATLGADCRVEAGAVIGANTVIGKRCLIRSNAVIDQGVTMGDDCSIGSCSTLSHAVLGNRVILHRGVQIGQDGFGYAHSREGHIKVPQLGRVVIDDDVEIGSGTCIDRGTGPDTHIGAGTKIDNLVQIGHNVVIGRHAIIVAQVGISGSCRIGDGAVLAGQVGLAGHLKIGAGAKLAAQSGVMTDIAPGAAYGGTPAIPVKDWHRQTIALSKLTRRRKEDHE